ncbi:hypothetical protein ABT308_01965, partial [Saccharopolyspora kobensis]
MFEPRRQLSATELDELGLVEFLPPRTVMSTLPAQADWGEVVVEGGDGGDGGGTGGGNGGGD